MDRRDWLRGLTALSLAGFGAAGWGQKPAKKGAVKVEDLQKNWKTLLAEGADVAASTEPLKLSDAEWKKRLSPAAYDVLRHEGKVIAGFDARKEAIAEMLDRAAGDTATLLADPALLDEEPGLVCNSRRPLASYLKHDRPDQYC